MPTTAAAVKPDLPLIGGAGRTTIAVQSVQSRNALEQAAVDAEAEAEDVPLHVAALLAVMVENGVLTADEIREGVQSIENWGAKAEGPRIIAKAW
jgi:hypothetical protein